MKHLILLITLVSLASCSHQKQTKPSGDVIENRNLLAKGGMTVAPDGTLIAFGDSEKAAAALAEYARAVLTARLIQTGIGAAKDLGETTINATTTQPTP
jgi:hypothetical protein